MTMNSSGPISLAGTTAGVSIQIENGGNGTTQISLNDAAVRSLAGVPSGAIIMPTNFYGKANQFSFAIAANTTNVNLRTAALAAGWNGSSKVVATINSGVVVYSATTGSYSLTISGSFPGGVELINNGTILGAGGRGGGAFGGGGCAFFQPGFTGGPALSVSSAVTINNGSGRIAGGGGGGGMGSDGSECGQPGKAGCMIYVYYKGGGGGGGIGNGPGGSGSSNGCGVYSASGNSGASGTLTGGGSGGSGIYGGAGPGGAGGSYGSAGANSGGGSGGAAGACINGNSNITYIAVGTRNGSIT